MQVANSSIRSIITQIHKGEIILPAFQREYVWKRRDIENLFDSLMQEFPINTMMFWNVSNIKGESLEFYHFLDLDYQEGVSINKPYKSIDKERKTIVIDGQQRLTSLYIGICGSYKTSKGKSKSYLYLNIDNRTVADDKEDEEGTIDTDKKYNFRFLTDARVSELSAKGEHWIKVSDAFDSDFLPSIYLNKCGLGADKETARILQKLYDLFNKGDVLNYYPVDKDKLEDVLDIFVRTNNGGRKLTKGDLLLSMITVNWASNNNENARDYVQTILNDCGYKGVDKDWVLTCILYILERDIKLSIEQFDAKTSALIYQKRDDIKNAITATFSLVKRYGMHEKGLSTKLALLPIAFHIYHYHLVDEINQEWQNGVGRSYSKGEYEKMRIWLYRAIAKNLFRAATNETLTKVLKIQIDSYKNNKQNYFPLDEIVKELNLNVSEMDLSELMQTEKKVSFPLLNIIYSDWPYFIQHLDGDFDVDHIHPKSKFGQNSSDNRHDTIPNLQLLNSHQNKSKNDLGLQNWWDAIVKNGNQNDYLFPDSFDPSPDSFDDFFEKRKEKLVRILAEKLAVSRDDGQKIDTH